MNLNHAVLFVTDANRASDFYTNVLEFEVMSDEADFNAVFLTACWTPRFRSSRP